MSRGAEKTACQSHEKSRHSSVTSVTDLSQIRTRAGTPTPSRIPSPAKTKIGQLNEQNWTDDKLEFSGTATSIGRFDSSESSGTG